MDDGKTTLPPIVSRETTERLELFAMLLLRWTSKINLIAPGDRAEVQRRHVADSLQLLPLLTAGLGRAVDLGSGGGFPGMVLAIASGVTFELVEADRRKAAFLREAARVTGAPVVVHCERIEVCRVAPAMLVTARALAPLPRLLGWAERLVLPGGILLLMKGASVEAELTDAAREWHMNVRRLPSVTHPSASILQITGLRRVRTGSPG